MSRAPVSTLPRALYVPAAAAVAFIAVPLIGLLLQVPWPALAGDVTASDVLTALRVSLECSLLALLFACVLGVPLGMLLARSRMRGRHVVRALVLLPLVLPPVVAGIALQSAFGTTTPIGSALRATTGITLPFTTLGAALSEAFVAFPFLVIAVESGMRQLDARHEEMAATLGAGRWTRLTQVTLPLLAPALAGGVTLCWARALGEFGATITFAGSFPGTTQTLPLAAYTAFEGAGDTGRAVTLSLLLLVISLAVLLAVRGRPMRPA